MNPSPPLNRNRPTLAPTLLCAVLYAAIGGVIWVAEHAGGGASGRWTARIAAWIIIAALQNHLQSLLHEGAHFRLHPRRAVNDFVSDVFCALPFLALTKQYRWFHFAHHRHLLDPVRDPEPAFYGEQGYFYRPESLPRLLGRLALDVSGYHYFQFLIAYTRYVRTEVRAGRMPPYRARDYALAATGVAVALALAGFSPWTLIDWSLPQPTFLFLLLKLQGYGEHRGAGSTIAEKTYGHRFGRVARFFVYPFNSDLHLEHHLFPSLPWYRLAEAHRTRTGLPSRPRRYLWGRDSFVRTELWR